MENLEVICRVCLKIFSEESLLSVFEESLDSKDIAEKIFLLSGILINAYDELMPKKICLECIDNINSAYMLREMMIKSDRFLHEINSVEFAIVEESSEINNEQIEGFGEEEVCGEEYLDEFIVDAENETLKNKTTKRVNPREPCYICAKLISKRNMYLHLKTHSNVNQNYMCDFCGKAFRIKSYLVSHIDNRHKITRKFQCHCGKSYNKRNTYEIHLKTHTGISLDSFNCKLCKKSFALKNRLKVNIL